MMYKNIYWLWLGVLNTSLLYSCEGPKTEGPVNQEHNQEVVVPKKIWERYGITTKQLEQEGRVYFGDKIITALLNDQLEPFPENTVHRIVAKVKFEEDSLKLATDFIRFVSVYAKEKNYFDGPNRRGLTPLAVLLLRPEFLSNYLAGTTSSPLLGMVQKITGYAGKPCCYKTASEYDKQELKRVLNTIAAHPLAHQYRTVLGLYDQYIELLTQGSKL